MSDKIKIVKKAIESIKGGELRFQRGVFKSGCEVCALGVLFVSLLRTEGEDVDRTIHSRHRIFQGMSDHWSEVQLHAIEEAFENGFCGAVPRYVEETETEIIGRHALLTAGPSHPLWCVMEARVWGLRTRRENGGNVEKVGLAILENMLQNEGNFLPPAVSAEEAREVLGSKV